MHGFRSGLVHPVIHHILRCELAHEGTLKMIVSYIIQKELLLMATAVHSFDT